MDTDLIVTLSFSDVELINGEIESEGSTCYICVNKKIRELLPINKVSK